MESLLEKITKMKTLIILRHGKAEQHSFDLDDYDRGLTSRGVKNSEQMGKFILKKQGMPDYILSSAAKRTYQTAVLAAKGMGFPKNEIVEDENLYLVPERNLLAALAELPTDVNFCVLVGHNPGMTALVNYFGVKLDNLPTASAVCFTFEMDTWENIATEKAEYQWIKLAREL